MPLLSCSYLLEILPLIRFRQASAIAYASTERIYKYSGNSSAVYPTHLQLLLLLRSIALGELLQGPRLSIEHLLGQWISRISSNNGTPPAGKIKTSDIIKNIKLTLERSHNQRRAAFFCSLFVMFKPDGQKN